MVFGDRDEGEIEMCFKFTNGKAIKIFLENMRYLKDAIRYRVMVFLRQPQSSVKLGLQILNLNESRLKCFQFSIQGLALVFLSLENKHTRKLL